MLTNKNILMEERREHQYRECHLALVLLFLLGISVLSSSNRVLGGVQAFSALLSVPVFTLICGRMSRQLEKRLISGCMGTVGLTALYAVSTLPGFWAAALARKKVVYDLLSPAYATGLFIFCALALPVAVWLEKRRFSKTLVLLCSLVLALAAGYVPGLSNPLCLRQLVSFLPLFLLGRWVNPGSLEKLLEQIWFKIFGVAVLLALLAGSFWKWKKLLDWGTVLMAGDAYSSIEAFSVELGAMVRLGQLAATVLGTLGLLSLCPNRPVGVFTRLSQYWYAGLFWHRGIAFALAVVMRREGEIALWRTALSGVLPLAACLPMAAVLPNWLLTLPQHLKDEHAVLRIKNRWRISIPFALYCLVFLLLLSQFVSAFVETGHTMTWVPDGENLYLVMMYYARNYFTGAFKTLLRTGKLVFPQWDFSIGQGASVLSVLKLNPFYLLSIPFPPRWMDYAYAIYTVAQLFCAALAFSALCRAMGQKAELSISIGSLVYVFSGYALFVAAKHVYFFTYLVLGLPLLLLGCERYLHKKKYGLFVIVVFFLFLGGYYYAWMDSLLMAIYLLIREINLHRGNIRKILLDLGQLVAFYLLGMALSMFVLLPNLVSLFSSSRSESLGSGTTLLYGSSHYKRLLTHLVSLDPTALNWAKLGLVGTVFLAIVVLFLRRKRRALRPFKMLTGLFVIFLCLPAVGSAFNGMGYATNRWTFGVSLLTALIFVWMLPELSRLSTREQQVVVVVSILYSAVTLHLDHGLTNIYSVLLFLLLTLTVLLANRLRDERLAQQVIAGATVAALLVHVGFFFNPGGLNNVDDYTEAGSGAKRYSHSDEAALTGLEDTLYRGEHNGNNRNTFCLTGGNGTCVYWSVLDKYMIDFFRSLEMDSLRMIYAVWGLDQRASLCSLGSVKYYASETANQVPYGFEEVGYGEGMEQTLYKNQYALPFGYTYTSVLSQEEYDMLSPLEKQQAILQSAVVSAEDKNAITQVLEHSKPRLTTVSIPWRAKETDKVDVGRNTFFVTEKNASITLYFEGLPDCETYLWLKGAKYKSGTPQSSVTVQGEGGGEKESVIYQENTLYYFERNGYTYNLGYSEKGMKSCTIRFERPGIYRAKDIQIVCLPMSDYVRDVRILGEVALEDVHETQYGGLTGHIESPDTRLLVFSVPCCKGWRLYLNGVQTTLMQVNGMYMGTLMTPGSYDVELRYSIPGLLLGTMISCAALLLFLLQGVWRMMKRRRSDENTGVIPK